MKKLLLLGGLRYLIPVIKTAQKMGVYVITCDYLPDNIAHKYSDEYHNVSIIDKEAVLKLARSLEIDGIMSFAVDPGVITAAYVSEKMGLPSAGPYESVKILQNKHLFREFLEKNNFNVPKARSYSNIDEAIEDFDYFDLPVMVKPVDSAGSKGVTKVSKVEELKPALSHAKESSKSGLIIIEDYLESKGCPSDSDCFSVDGKLDIITFSNQRFDSNSPNPYTPSAYSWPSSISEKNKIELKQELQRLIHLLDMKSSIYNIEVREATDGKAYIMEVSPRGGGNRLSEVIHYATGLDLISYSIKAALGENIENIPELTYDGNWAEVILYSNIEGSFAELKISPTIEKYIVETDLWVQKGEKINAFTGANEAIGTVVLNFDDSERLEEVLSDYSQYFNVVVE
jgi:carbamoylphosphate synthase large subunit